MTSNGIVLETENSNAMSIYSSHLNFDYDFVICP
jgi:hypothetical protein